VDIINYVIQEFSKLPGIGKKSASRITYHLLKANQSKGTHLIQAIQQLKNIISCSLCGNYAETDPCDICMDDSRDQSVICVIEEAKDIQTIESTHAFFVLYHVLGGVISPLHGISPQDLRISEIAERIREKSVREIIIATNPTVEGDTTALFLSQILKNLPISVSRIALGIPIGGDLEYADKLTLTQALKGRTKI
jgi:recombination protein RecR